MNRSWGTIVQSAFIGMLAWSVFSWLAKWHLMIVLVIAVMATINALTVFALRQRWPAVELACRFGGVRGYVNWIARASREQLPPAATRQSALLLQSKRDFDVAAERAKQVVRGHNRAIELALSRIYENGALAARRRHKQRERGPIASFWLIGQAGIGKEHLARVLAKLLFERATITVVDCDHAQATALVGNKAHEGELIRAVSRNPEQVLFFDNVDRASADITSLLDQLLRSGILCPPGGREVSCQGTVVVMSMSAGVESLAQLRDEVASETAWHSQAAGVLAAASNIDATVFQMATEILYCAAPDDITKSEVISLLMKRECIEHSTQLTYVEPQIVAAQVIQLSEESGFATAPGLVKNLLRRPLIAAASGDHRNLSLRVRNTATSNKQPTWTP